MEKKFVPALSYDFLTGFYDWTIKKIMPANFLEILIELIHPSPGDTILDFGTGTGEISIMAKKACDRSNVIAIDIDEKILKIAQRKIESNHLNIELVRYDGQGLPFEENSFTKVVSSLVFHHLSAEDKNKMLAEIFRVLKPNGKLYIADWGLERNKFKSKLVKFIKHIKPLENSLGNALGLLPQYIAAAGFTDVVELTYMKTITGTLSYYRGVKR